MVDSGPLRPLPCVCDRASLDQVARKTPLRDEYGQALAQDWVGKLELDDFWPKADIGVQGVYLEASEKRDIPVLAVNVREMRVASMALKPDDVFAFGPASNDSANGFDKIVGLGASPTLVRPAGAKNTAAKFWVHGDDLLGGKGRTRADRRCGGVHRAARNARGARGQSARIVQITDLAISAKVSHEGTLVWVTRLSSGAPVSGAAVEVKRGPQQGGASSGVLQTDGDGFVTIPKEKFVPLEHGVDSATIFVRTRDDWAYRYVLDTLSGWRFGASIEGGNDEAPIGMVFTERGLYRPGDTVKVKGIVREARPRGTATPAGKEVRLELKGPDGEKVSDHNAKLSAFGTFAFDVKVPEAGKLGELPARCEHRRARNRVGRHPRFVRGSRVPTCRVQGWRRRALRPLARSDRGASSYVRGDKGSWTMQRRFSVRRSDAESRSSLHDHPQPHRVHPSLARRLHHRREAVHRRSAQRFAAVVRNSERTRPTR